MQRAVVLIERYDSRSEAEAAHVRLAAAGIECQLSHELEGGSRPKVVVALRVPLGEEDRARRVLAGWGDAPVGPLTEELRCLICQSSLVEVVQYGLPVRLAILLLLQAVPLPRAWFEPRGRRCAVCGHEWRHGALPGSTA